VTPEKSKVVVVLVTVAEAAAAEATIVDLHRSLKWSVVMFCKWLYHNSIID